MSVALGGEPPDVVLETSDDAEEKRKALLSVCDRYEWNLAAVARFLGWSRTTLYKRMKILNVPRKRVPKSRTRGEA